MARIRFCEIGRQIDAHDVALFVEQRIDEPGVWLLKPLCSCRLRVVNVADLLILEKESDHSHGLDAALFDALFAPDAPVIVNFHWLFERGETASLRTQCAALDDLQQAQAQGWQVRGGGTSDADTPLDLQLERVRVGMYGQRSWTVKRSRSDGCGF
jgi:phosphoketolase